MIRPENETEALLLSIVKNCQKLFEQTHKETEETLELKLTNPRETFHFNPPMSIEGSWTEDLTKLEVYSSIFICNGGG